MGVYDVADGDLYSPQQLDYARQQKLAGRKRMVDPKSKRMVAVTKAKDRQFEQPRGTGMTGKTSLPLTDGDRATIHMLHGRGLSSGEIAKIVNRTPRKVQTVIEEAENVSLKVGLNWREIMKDKAVLAVNDALDHKDDLYKRGNLGIQALKGLNEMSPDGVLNLNAIISSVPPDMRDRYLSSDDLIEGEIKEVPDAIHDEKRENDGLHDTQE